MIKIAGETRVELRLINDDIVLTDTGCVYRKEMMVPTCSSPEAKPRTADNPLGMRRVRRSLACLLLSSTLNMICTLRK
jgi:hypothetical protein